MTLAASSYTAFEICNLIAIRKEEVFKGKKKIEEVLHYTM